jgi:hypothetical protein
MCDTVHASTNNFRSDDPVRLDSCDGYRGDLTEIIESEGETILARVDGALIELPNCLASKLRGLVGQRIVIVNVAGQTRAGRSA